METAQETRRRAAEWFKATASDNGGGCVEVARRGEGVSVRDSRDPAGPVLHFSGKEWTEFIAGVHAGEFDLTT
ncbi:DUF397 domain-containing protein [Spongiactinospora gelatinilytica]|uniref:DUF397 domain-containing protein n=1 Tax=Spongiactinospora gelatinilytica TaxID=2666298 RepID=A0A2W2H0E9_9ACTN|nr:DUF397 domain-containing protein [Spongiactinospora gelatinilytica]PZG55536.1 DUF397 domain-containing protein [Spongiactinospora gelatinilytica]